MGKIPLIILQKYRLSNLNKDYKIKHVIKFINHPPQLIGGLK